MLSVSNKPPYVECLYAECLYAECRYAECCGTGQKLELDLNGHNYVRPSREYFSSTWGSTLKLFTATVKSVSTSVSSTIL